MDVRGIVKLIEINFLAAVCESHKKGNVLNLPQQRKHKYVIYCNVTFSLPVMTEKLIRILFE